MAQPDKDGQHGRIQDGANQFERVKFLDKVTFRKKTNHLTLLC